MRQVPKEEFDAILSQISKYSSDEFKSFLEARYIFFTGCDEIGFQKYKCLKYHKANFILNFFFPSTEHEEDY